MGDERGPGPDDVVIDGVWIGEPEGGGCDQAAAGCALAIFITLAVPPIAWWALGRGAEPAGRGEGSPGAGLAWGMTFVWFVLATWSVFALVVSCAYVLGRSMAATMLGFAAVFGVMVLAIAFVG